MVVRMPCIGVVLNWRGEPHKSGLYPVHICIKTGNTVRYYQKAVNFVRRQENTKPVTWHLG